MEPPKSHFSFGANRSLSNHKLQDACGGSPVSAAVVLAQDRPLRHPSLSGSSCWQLPLLPEVIQWIYLNFKIYTSLTFSPSAFQRGVWSSIRLCTSRYSTSMRTATFPLQGSKLLNLMRCLHFICSGSLMWRHLILWSGQLFAWIVLYKLAKIITGEWSFFHQLGTAKSMHSFSLLQLAI